MLQYLFLFEEFFFQFFQYFLFFFQTFHFLDHTSVEGSFGFFESFDLCFDFPIENFIHFQFISLELLAVFQFFFLSFRERNDLKRSL